MIRAGEKSQAGAFRRFPRHMQDGFWFLFSVRSCFFRHDISSVGRWPNKTSRAICALCVVVPCRRLPSYYVYSYSIMGGTIRQVCTITIFFYSVDRYE